MFAAGKGTAWEALQRLSGLNGRFSFSLNAVKMRADRKTKQQINKRGMELHAIFRGQFSAAGKK